MNREDLNQKISRLIIAARTEKGWTQADLAKACLKHPQAIARWESGAVNPSIYVLYEMAEAMDIPLCRLTDIDTLKQEKSLTVT